MSRKKENKSIYLLLVEDSQRYLDELYEWFFNIYEYKNIEVAKSEKQAKEKLDQLFDVIIADMRMESNESGFAIVDEVKKRNLSSVVIILTANETVADCREAFKKEAWDYISKGMKGNVFEEVHKSIQQAVEYFNQWGNKQDRKWIDDNFEELLDKYSEQYIAVLNNRVIGNHDSKEELEKELHLKKLPTFLTILERVSISEQNVIKQLKTEIEQAQKPVIYVEGKTDKLILECAWQKLYGNRSQPFLINAITIGNEKSGGATVLKQLLSVIQPDIHNIVVGIFDYDHEGKKAYKSLTNYHEIQKPQAKILEHYKATAFLLPVPEFRRANEEKCNFCIEYYFNDSALSKKTTEGWGLQLDYYKQKKIVEMPGNPTVGEPIKEEKPEFRKIIRGKTVFAEKIVPELPESDFKEFTILFDKINKIINYLIQKENMKQQEKRKEE